MSNTYQMQARSTTTGRIITWMYVGSSPDNMGLEWPGPGSPEYIASTLYVGLSTPAVAVAAPLAIVPATGPTTGGTHVVIQVASSVGLVRATIGSDVDNFAIDDPTHVSGDTVAGTGGADPVTVGTVNGTSAPLVNGFTYVAPPVPTVVSLDHDLGDTLGGNTVVITGTGLTSASAVSNAASFVVNSPTQITAVMAAHAAGIRSIAVTTPGGTSNAATYEYWDPTVPMAPTFFAEKGGYTTPAGVGQLVARSSTLGLTLAAASGGTSPTNSSGAPLFVAASATHLDAGAATPDDLIGRARTVGCTIAVVLDVTSIIAQGANVYDNQMVIGDTFQNTGLYLGGASANKAILDITIAGSVDKQAAVTIPTSGRAVIVGERDVSGTPFVKITANQTPTWTNGPTLASDTDTGGLVTMGKSVYSAGHGASAQASLDAKVLAVVCVKQGWSDANVTKFFKWAASRFP